MSELQKALARNDISAATALLDAGAVLPADALERVLRYGFQEMAELVRARGGALSRPGRGLDTAGAGGNLALLQWVYDTGLDTVVTSSIDFLATRATPEDVKVAIAEFFLAHGADGQKWAEASMTIPGCVAVAKLLVSRGLFNVKAKTSLVFRNNKNEYVAIEDFLALRGLEHPYTLAVLPDGSNALYVAIHDGDVAEVQRLLAAAPSPSLDTALHASTGTPLVYATSRGNAAIIEALTAAAAEVAAGAGGGGGAAAAPVTDDLILAAVASGSVEALAPLLARRSRDTPLPAGALAKAVAAGLVTIVYVLLGAGADPNALNADRVPPLGVLALHARVSPTVARAEHVMIANALIGAGADPNAHVAVLYGSCKAYTKRSASALAAALGW